MAKFDFSKNISLSLKLKKTNSQNNYDTNKKEESEDNLHFFDVNKTNIEKAISTFKENIFPYFQDNDDNESVNEIIDFFPEYTSISEADAQTQQHDRSVPYQLTDIEEEYQDVLKDIEDNDNEIDYNDLEDEILRAQKNGDKKIIELDPDNSSDEVIDMDYIKDLIDMFPEDDKETVNKIIKLITDESNDIAIKDRIFLLRYLNDNYQFDETKEFKELTKKDEIFAKILKQSRNNTIGNIVIVDKLNSTQSDKINELDETYVNTSNNESEDNLEDDSEWENIEPQEGNFLLGSNGKYEYITEDGIKITVDDIENVQVLINKNTGEVMIIGAKGAQITGSGKHDKIKVIDSEVTSIDLKGGNDSIEIINSTVEKVEGGKGDDYIYVEKSSIEKLDSGNDNDDIYVNNSQIGEITSGKGDDAIIVSNSSTVKNIFGGKGNDVIEITDSEAETIDTGKGSDTVFENNSKINEIKNNENEIKTTDSVEETCPVASLDESSAVEAQDITAEKTSKYSDMELTPEEQLKALTIDRLTENLENMRSQFEEQLNNEGIVSDGYNFIKELMELGVSREDIEKALEEQEQMIKELTDALNSDSDLSFEEVFKKWTGIEYNEDNINEYFESASLYNLAVTGLTRTENFIDRISNASDLQSVLDLYTQYYGSESKGREELNKLLKKSFLLNPELFGYVKSVEINDENQLVVTRYDDVVAYMHQDESQTSTTIEDISKVTNMIRTMPMGFDLSQYTQEYIENLESSTGKTFNDIQSAYVKNQLKAFGKNNSIQKLVDRYCSEQEGFADKLALVVQTTGMGLIVVGGVVSFVCPPVGLSLMTAGKYTSVAGMFSDNALEILDDITSENGLTKEEGLEFVKDTLQEILLLYSGQKINSIAGGVKNIVLNETQSKVLAFLSEIGTDATLSLMCDYMITGEVDITGEGISQLLGIISGIAGAKINAYYKESFDNASLYFKNNDVDGAYEYLKSRGISDKQIFKQFAGTEINRIVEDYKETGDYDSALAKLQQSKILQINSDSAERQLFNSCHNAERAKVIDMIKNGTDYDSIQKYIENSKVLTDADLEYFNFNYEGAELLSQLKHEFGNKYNKYKDVDFSTQQGKMILQDLKLLLEAKRLGVDVNDLMVKTYTSEASIANVELGEVFVFNDKLCIKTDSGTGWETLNISKEKYCELFPPVERYASKQGQSGDCYLVSALNTMMADPRGKLQLLSCLTENSDGSITVKLPDSESEITIENGKDITSLGVDPKKCVSGALGMQLLEYAYKVEHYVKDGPASQISEKINITNESLNQLMLDWDDECKELGINSVEELKAKSREMGEELKSKYNITDNADVRTLLLWADMANHNKVDPDMAERRIIDCLGTSDPDVIKEIKEYVAKNHILCEAYEHVLDIDEYQKELLELAEKEYEYQDVEKEGGNGGHSNDVFAAFGFKNSQYYYDQASISDFIDKLIANPELQDKYVMTAGSGFSSVDNNIASTHAYSFEIIFENGVPMVKVTNPWGAGASKPQMLTMTIEEFMQNFRSLYIAEIP